MLGRLFNAAKNLKTKTLEYAKQNPKKTAVTATVAGTAGLAAIPSNDTAKQKQPATPQQQPQQDTTRYYTGTEQLVSDVIDLKILEALGVFGGKPGTGGNKPKGGGVKTQIATETQKPVSPELPYIQALQLITNDLKNQAAQYEELRAMYDKATNEYLGKVKELLPLTVLAMGKVGLHDITGEDLPKHIETYLAYTPYTAGVDNLPFLIKGYYTMKLAGMETQNLKPTDFIQAGQNPEMVGNINEQIMKAIELASGVIQTKYKSELDRIGIVKDQIDMNLKVKSFEADIYRTMLDSVFKKMQLELQDKNITLDYLAKMASVAAERERNKILAANQSQENLLNLIKTLAYLKNIYIGAEKPQIQAEKQQNQQGLFP